MTPRQEKELVDNSIMFLKCIMALIALCVFAAGHPFLAVLMVAKEVIELILFCVRVVHEEKYHDVLK